MTDSDPSAAKMPASPAHSGDSGRTHFGGYGETAKHDVRVDAFGACAEANASVGVAMAVGRLPIEINSLLTSVQNDMLDLAADLSVPLDSPEEAEARITAGHVRRLERAVDHFIGDINPRAAVLPGGTVAAALLYNSRNVVRRAERAVWRAVEEHPETISPLGGQYLNRLSSLLLVLARQANAEHGNLEWEPGASARAMFGTKNENGAGTA